MSENPELKTLLDEFETHLKSRDRSAHSIRAYLSDVRLFAAWFAEQAGEPFSPEAVTEYDVQAWRDEMVEERKPATINRRLAALSAFFEWARDKRIVKQDPAQYVHGVQQDTIAPKGLSKQDVRRILRQAKLNGTLRDLALLEFLAATGLRAAEVSALRYGDLEIGDRSGWITVRSGKGRKRRRVPVNAHARAVLVEYLDTRGELKRDTPLFLSRLSEAMTPYAVWYTVKKYAEMAKVKNVSPHSFRHTVATRLVRDPEVDLVTAATYLGHSRLDTTARYSKPSDEDLEKAAERL